MNGYENNIFVFFPVNNTDIPLFSHKLDTFNCNEHLCFIIPKATVGIIKNSFGKAGVDISQLVS